MIIGYHWWIFWIFESRQGDAWFLDVAQCYTGYVHGSCFFAHWNQGKNFWLMVATSSRMAKMKRFRTLQELPVAPGSENGVLSVMTIYWYIRWNDFCCSWCPDPCFRWHLALLHSYCITQCFWSCLLRCETWCTSSRIQVQQLCKPCSRLFAVCFHVISRPKPPFWVSERWRSSCQLQSFAARKSWEVSERCWCRTFMLGVRVCQAAVESTGTVKISWHHIFHIPDILWCLCQWYLMMHFKIF